MRRALVLCLAALSGCPAPGAGGPPVVVVPPDAKPGLFFPLAEGGAWSYDVTDATTGQKNVLLNRVTRTDGPRAVFFDGAEPLSYEDQGEQIIRWPSGTVVLKAPLVVGTAWTVPNGSAKIVAAGAQVAAVHDHYGGCVVVEEITAETRVLTSFAPQVGPVKVEVWARGPGGEQLLSTGLLRGYHKAGSQL